MIIKHLPDSQNEEIAVIAQNEQDLFLISQLLQQNDIVSAKTTRKMQTNDQKSIRKSLKLEIKVQSVSYQQQELEIVVQGLITRSSDPDVSIGQSHSLHIQPFVKVTIVKQQLLETQRAAIITAADPSRFAQCFVILILRDGTAKFAYADEHEFFQVERFSQNIPKKDGYNESSISSRFSEFMTKLAVTISQKLNTNKIKQIYVLGQDDIIQQFQKEFEKRINTQNISIRFQHCSAVNFGDAHREIFHEQMQETAVFDLFKKNMQKDNDMYFCGIDCIRCLQQQPRTVESALIAKSLLAGDNRVEIDTIIQRIHTGSLRTAGINLILVSDSSDVGQRLRSYGGILCNTKYPVFLGGDEVRGAGQEFTEWEHFDEISCE